MLLDTQKLLYIEFQSNLKLSVLEVKPEDAVELDPAGITVQISATHERLLIPWTSVKLVRQPL
jgi:hypothetical protein